MSEKKQHPIRNRVLGTVIGGALLSLWPDFRAALAVGWSWLWGHVVSAWTALITPHLIYGWFIFILVCFSLPTVFKIFAKMVLNRDPDPTALYLRDDLFGASWHWEYDNGSISRLHSMCPQCQSELVHTEYVQDRYGPRNPHLPKTDFYCERCDVTRSSIQGEYFYALGLVGREIRRKIRTGEWKKQVADKS